MTVAFPRPARRIVNMMPIVMGDIESLPTELRPYHGIWLASSDGDCLVWDERVPASDVDRHGALLVAPATSPRRLAANALYRITDRTPHTAVPAERTHYRRFFRLVGPEVFGWFSLHSTPHPLGVKPKCPVIATSKFGAP